VQLAGSHEVEAALIAIEQQEFIELRNAIQRIEDNGYGFCVRCKQAIPFDRLQREPQTERCMRCEAAFEATTG
jgi:RNA polymerase-binding transcription factor DksA